MPFLRRQDIDPKIRARFERAVKAQLRQSLMNPVLTPEHREVLKQRLAQVDQPKVYSRTSPPPVGAISFDD